MAISWSLWDRTTLLVIVSILGVSSGVASFAPQVVDGVTGHTTYVSAVVLVDAPEPTPHPTVTYGLATYRDIRFFGVWNVERIAPASQDRMVFVWSADAADPRDGALVPTGAFAHVRDRMGVEWEVFEFTYLAEGQRHYAYGVRVGEVHHADDPTIGTDGHYNHVLVYRPERLLSPTPATAAPAEAATDDHGLDATPELPGGLGSARSEPTAEETLETVERMREAQDPDGPAKPRLAFGLGATPAGVDGAGAARGPQAAVSAVSR